MQKGLIAFIVAAATGLVSTVIIYMKKPANDSVRKSQELFEEFKRVDSSLKQNSIQADSSMNRVLDSLKKQIK